LVDLMSAARSRFLVRFGQTDGDGREFGPPAIGARELVLALDVVASGLVVAAQQEEHQHASAGRHDDSG